MISESQGDNYSTQRVERISSKKRVRVENDSCDSPLPTSRFEILGKAELSSSYGKEGGNMQAARNNLDSKLLRLLVATLKAQEMVCRSKSI